MGKDGNGNSVLPQIVATVVVALLVGGTSPWWWNEFFATKEGKDPPSPNVSESAYAPIGGPITVTATANPPIVSVREKTTVNVYVQDSQGQALAEAVVTLSSGGGQFDHSGTTRVSGPTNSSGVFRALWSCDPCSQGYTGSVRVTKSGYHEAQTRWQIRIR